MASKVQGCEFNHLQVKMAVTGNLASIGTQEGSPVSVFPWRMLPQCKENGSANISIVVLLWGHLNGLAIIRWPIAIRAT